MIDLHIHSTCSDGLDDVIEILRKSQELNLEFISITDHCTCEANQILKNTDISQYFSGKIIIGCEVTCKFRNQIIEVLAYGFDDSLQGWLDLYYSREKFHENQKRHFKKLKDICKQMGLKFNQELEIINIKHGADRVIYEELKMHEENKIFFDDESWNHLGNFYRHCVCNAESPFYINMLEDYPTLKEAVEQIKKANGLAFLAHLFEYSFEDKFELLESAVKHKLDGIECYYSHFTQQQTDFLINYCKEKNLFISGGSDYHGNAKPDIKLGTGTGNLNIPYEVILPWLNCEDICL